MPTIVYVHGAGEQEPPKEKKDELDRALGVPSESTIFAHYSRVHWGDPPREADVRGTIEKLADFRIPPEAAAEELVATLASAEDIASSADEADLLALLADLYGAADAIAKSGTDQIQMWDRLFRVIVGFVGADVAAYLFGNRAEAMQAPVRRKLEPLVGKPIIVIAHSLGSIVTYDLLDAIAGMNVTMLLTAGSPLGISNVQDRLRRRAGRPNPVPAGVGQWSNVYDDRDPVSFLQKQIGGEFELPNLIDDRPPVDNRREQSHALRGYLELPSVHALLGLP